jgi:serine/threonine protein kinase
MTVCLRCGADQHGAEPCRESLVGRTLGGGLYLLKRLGETSLGQLYGGEYPGGAEAEVLVLSADSSAGEILDPLRERFRQASRIQHPNVGAIGELRETDSGLVYLVAESLPGELLSVTLTRRGALPLDEALNLGLQAAAGLQAAHRVNWIHGRLSPETILLSHAGGRPLIKLVGFDLELLLRPNGAAPMTREDMSADYASPERIAGRPPDERSDVYSLGAVLHHLLTGRPPNRSWGRAVPAELKAALNRALAPVPSLRFQTAGEFAAALRSARSEADQVVPAQPKPGRSGVLAIGAAAGFVGTVVFWLLSGAQQPPAAPATRARPQESARAVDSGSSSAYARLPQPAEPAPPGRRDSAATPPPIKLSPFLRSRPWIAIEGQRFYYSRNCLIQLNSPHLLYFRGEQQARARGFTRYPLPGCPDSPLPGSSLDR